MLGRLVAPLKLLGTVVCLGLLGCGGTPDSYPSELRYPLREDPLVYAVPNRIPPAPIEPGQLDESIAQLPALGGKLYFPKELTESNQVSLRSALDDLFGTPASPTVHDPLAEKLGWSDPQLIDGSKHFRRLCVQCHGLTGNGRGPTGLWITPTPRDFRTGAFKFVSSKGSAPRKANRDDLLRTLRHGIPGTAMPSFAMLSDAELESLASYVQHLSSRGETEYRMMLVLLSEGETALDGSIAEVARDELSRIVREWQLADEERIAPQAELTELTDEERLQLAHLASVERGYRIFTGKETGACISCHENYGRIVAARYDMWGTQVRPANLTEPTYKGGKRPLDWYFRVRGGIAPSGMPAASHLNETQLLDVVHFIQALPYPRMLPPVVRSVVYPAESVQTTPPTTPSISP